MLTGVASIKTTEMIAYLNGLYTELTPTAVLVECAGVGYHVSISQGCLVQQFIFVDGVT